MISSEMQRTLVKSPPELWTELSDPAALGRHLGEFGEIRITRVEPEKAVEWEAEKATGTVLIKPSGWGTRVTLTLSRELPAPEEPATSTPVAAEEPAAALQSEPGLDAPPTPQVPKAATEAETAAAQQLAERGEHWQQAAELQCGEPQGTSEDEAAVSREQEADWEEDWQCDAEPKTEPRRGFLARLFGWRRRGAAELDQLAGGEDARAAARGGAAARGASRTRAQSRLSPTAHGAHRRRAPARWGPQPGCGRAGSAELRAAEEVAAEEVAAVLSAMLDRLGTAHHRPFSRA